MQRNGAGYCTQHDPERIRSKNAERFKRFKAMSDAEVQEHALKRECERKRRAVLAEAKALVDARIPSLIDLRKLVTELRKLEERLPRARAEVEEARAAHQKLIGGKKARR